MDAMVTATEVEEVGSNTYAIRFESPAGFSAEPGQFVKLGTDIDGEAVSRFYTLSSPNTNESFEVTVGIDPEDGGEFSAFLADIRPGVEMSLSGPYGDDHYDGELRTIVLAGGPGIGPAVAIADRSIADGGEAAIVYRDDDPAYEDRIEELRNEGVKVHTLTESESLLGPVSEVLTGGMGETVFVYGFADFVTDAEAAIEAAGGDPSAAKIENFG